MTNIKIETFAPVFDVMKKILFNKTSVSQQRFDIRIVARKITECLIQID
jgi:hypothetical protein